MTIRDRKALRQTAGRRLQVASFSPNKLVLIHSGVALAFTLLVAVLNYILDGQIRAHGGLSGIDKRALLETAATVLSMVYSVLTPFWSMGIVYAALRIARGKATYPQTLPEGFRRFGPVLRLILMQTLIYGILCFVAMYVSGVLFAFTPAGTELGQQLQSMILSGEFEDYYQVMEALSEQTIGQLYRVVMPIFGVVALVLIVPAFYRMRMASYVLMDKSGTGAWKAVRTSGRIMKHKGVQMFKLDLSFWWYYLISVLLTLPIYADLLLPLVGIQLPMEEELVVLVGYVIHGVLMLIFEVAALPKVMTTYALAYDALLEEYEQVQSVSPAESVEYADIYANVPKNEE